MTFEMAGRMAQTERALGADILLLRRGHYFFRLLDFVFSAPVTFPLLIEA